MKIWLRLWKIVIGAKWFFKGYKSQVFINKWSLIMISGISEQVNGQLELIINKLVKINPRKIDLIVWLIKYCGTYRYLTSLTCNLLTHLNQSLNFILRINQQIIIDFKFLRIEQNNNCRATKFEVAHLVTFLDLLVCYISVFNTAYHSCTNWDKNNVSMIRSL